MKKIALSFAPLTALVFGAAGSLACTSNPPQPPPSFWTSFLGYDPVKNTNDFLIGQEISLFPPATLTNCACGLGLRASGGGPVPLPPGSIAIKDAFVAIVDTSTHQFTALPNFTFFSNANATAGLAALQPGWSWLGLATTVLPFVPPQLAPGFVFKLLFTVNVAATVPLITLEGLVGAGEGNPNGGPNPTAFHFFSPENNSISVPAPGASGLLAIALVAAARRRR